jgi:hypothetical protein
VNKATATAIDIAVDASGVEVLIGAATALFHFFEFHGNCILC